VFHRIDQQQYFAHHPELLSEIIDLSVLELRLGTSEAKLDKLISINKKLPAIEAFKLVIYIQQRDVCTGLTRGR
jgi:hypothetical protein